MNLPILAYMLIFNWYNRNRLPNNRPAYTAWNSPIRPSGLKSSPKVQLICTSTFDLSLSKGPAKACSPKSESIVLLRAIVKPRRVHEGYSQNVTALGSVEILRATYRLGETLFTFPVYRAFSRQSAGVGLLHWPVTISTSALVNNYKGLYVLPSLNTGKFCASLTPNSGFSRSSAGGDSMDPLKAQLYLREDSSKQSRVSLNAPLTFKFSHFARQGGAERCDFRHKMGFLISLLLAGRLLSMILLSDGLPFGIDRTVEVNLIGAVSERLFISSAMATDLCTSCSMDPYAASLGSTEADSARPE
ncbi:hypothetical protein T4D_106 [Trichinella pseudospiralis]|uniref:Uncharacterized protein n=1 Tax=Trichinella pseudospiralis TaxID=6337 RepID=A0A0V1FLY5_TRIPS|nr:hypothetical protein T4D_106 [Trichinella pseudospiralis]